VAIEPVLAGLADSYSRGSTWLIAEILLWRSRSHSRPRRPGAVEGAIAQLAQGGDCVAGARERYCVNNER